MNAKPVVDRERRRQQQADEAARGRPRKLRQRRATVGMQPHLLAQCLRQPGHNKGEVESESAPAK